jgi:hypothetical protein
VNTDSIDMVPVLVYCFTFEVARVDYNKKIYHSKRNVNPVFDIKYVGNRP